LSDPSARPVAIVTGASQGFGAATAKRLAAAGYDLALTATDVAHLSAVKAALDGTQARVELIALDLKSPPQIEHAMETTIGTFGRLDALVNNAGVPLRKAALETTLAEWQEVMRVNLTGTFVLCQAMGRYLIDAGRGGSIVNVASTHGVVALAGRCAYGVSKAGVMHLTRMLAVEWAPHRIRVNAIAPGAAETETRADYLADPETRRRTLDRIPLGNFCTAGEVANAVAYLIGPDAASITGQTLVIDGGLTVS
jgi:NAD(P)-dependent dehydrogenase (short-subunit alcohol dehydrogenase family)